MSENHPLRVRSASPRVRLFGNHSRRGKSPSVDPTLEAHRRDVERTIKRDPISYPVHTVTPRGRTPERATTTETQRSLTNNVHLEQYSRLCENLRASESIHLDPTHFLKEAEHVLEIANYRIQHDAEGHIQSKDEAYVREYPASHSRNSREAVMLRGYLEVEVLHQTLLLPMLYSGHRMHIQQSRYRANSLEIHCEMLQNSLTDAKSVETMRHEIALLRATADHAEFDFKLGDQHLKNLIAIHQKTIDEYFRCEDVKEVILRGINSEFDERVRYRRARDSSSRQWDAQLQVLYKKNMEYYRRLSFRDVGVANDASGDTSREDRVGEQREMSHVSPEGPGIPKLVRRRQAVLSRAATHPQSHQQSLEAQTAEMPSRLHQTNRERPQQPEMQQAIREAVQAATRAANAMKNAKNGSRASMQGEHTSRDQKQKSAINNTNGRLGEPKGHTRHRKAQPRTPLSAPPTQVSPLRNMGSGRNHETGKYDSNSSQSMSPYYVARATVEQAQRKREDSQHNGGAKSKLEAEGYATEGSDSTMDPTVGMRSSVVSIVALDSPDSNDSSRRSTAGTRGGEDNNPSNERASPAGSSYIPYASDWTLVSRPSQSCPKFSQHWPNITSTSGSTPTAQPSAPGNLGVTRRPTRPSLSPLQCPPRSTDPSTPPSLSFSRAEFELAIRSNVTKNMDLIPCAPASASPPIQFQVPCDPSLLHLPTPGAPPKPAPNPPITADTYPDPDWNAADSRTWIYENLVTYCGFPKLDAYNIVTGWTGGGGIDLHLMNLFDWQMTTSYHAGCFIFDRIH